MSMDAYPAYNSEPDTMTVIVTFSGNGTGAPTKLYGKNIALTRTGVGAFLLTFQDPPGNLVSFGGDFGSSTPAGVAGFTAVAGAYTQASGATKASLPVTVYNSSFAATDLASATAQTLYLTLDFKRAATSL